MKSLISISSILLLTLTSSYLTSADDTIDVPYKLCTPTASTSSSSVSGTPTITIDSVKANVWPPVPGKLFDIIAKGSSNEDILGGTYHIEVKLDDLTVLDKKGDLRDVGITFPIKANQPTEIHKSIKVPGNVPDGQIVVTGHAYDSSKNELLCVIVTADLTPPDDMVQQSSSSSNIDSMKLGKIVIPNLSHRIGDIEAQYKEQQQQQQSNEVMNAVIQHMSEPVEIIEIHISSNDNNAVAVPPSLHSLMNSIAYSMQQSIHRMRTGMMGWYGTRFGRAGIDVIDLSRLPAKSYTYDITHDDSDIIRSNTVNEDELHDLPYSLCGDEDDPIQITSIKADNWPLVAGKPITMYVTANVTKEIDNGVYEAKVLFDGLQVIDKKDTLEHLGVEMPLKPGENKFHKKFDVPKNIPQGDVLLSATAHTTDGVELVCATIEMHL